MSWEEVEFYAAMLQIPTVPVLFKGRSDALPDISVLSPTEKLTDFIQRAVQQASSLSDPQAGFVQREGVVARVARELSTEEFSQCVFKWVRKNHVKTDEHWTRNWKRARLNRERPAVKPGGSNGAACHNGPQCSAP